MGSPSHTLTLNKFYASNSRIVGSINVVRWKQTLYLQRRLFALWHRRRAYCNGLLPLYKVWCYRSEWGEHLMIKRLIKLQRQSQWTEQTLPYRSDVSPACWFFLLFYLTYFKTVRYNLYDCSYFHYVWPEFSSFLLKFIEKSVLCFKILSSSIRIARKQFDN